jgi:hypothetical protein
MIHKTHFVMGHITFATCSYQMTSFEMSNQMSIHLYKIILPLIPTQSQTVIYRTTEVTGLSWSFSCKISFVLHIRNTVCGVFLCIKLLREIVFFLLMTCLLASTSWNDVVIMWLCGIDIRRFSKHLMIIRSQSSFTDIYWWFKNKNKKNYVGKNFAKVRWGANHFANTLITQPLFLDKYLGRPNTGVWYCSHMARESCFR